MTTNFPEFAAKLRQMSESIPRVHLPQLQARVAIRFLSGVTMRNPVLTGRSRNGWYVAQGSPSQELNMDGGFRAAGDVVSDGEKQLVGLEPFGIVYVTNNVHYIGELDKGSSAQAPQGMRRLTLEEIQADLL